MKRKWEIALLTQTMLLSTMGTSWAAPNPAQDVHDAQQAQEAQQQQQAWEQEKEQDQKLYSDLMTQVQALNKRMARMEKKNLQPKLEMFGYSRIRYDRRREGNNPDESVKMIRLNLDTRFHINEHWSLFSENEFENDLQNNTGAYENNGYQRPILQLYAEGNYGKTRVRLGRFYHLSPYELTCDEKIDGYQIRYGNPEDKLKLLFQAGNMYSRIMYGYTGTGHADPWQDGNTNYRVIAGEAEYRLTKDTNLKGVYGKVTRRDTNKGFNVYEIGFDTKISPFFNFYAARSGSTMDTWNKSHVLSLQYKNAIPDVPGSYDIYIKKYMLRGHSSLSNWFINDLSDHDDNWNSRYAEYNGIRIGLDYVPVKNTKLLVNYTFGTGHLFSPDNPTDRSKGRENASLFRAEWQLYF